jgi:hypothetical protein
MASYITTGYAGSGTFISNETVWTAWNGTSTFSSGSPLYSTAGPVTMTNMTFTLSDTVWRGWNGAYQETAEARAAREAEFAQAQADLSRAQQQRLAERAVASARAEELLLSLLTPEQAASYRERGWFEVRGSQGGRWRIRNRGQSGNVDLMPEIGEEREATYCAHPPGSLPDADAHTAQMLQLVTDEDAFLKVANLHWRRPAPRPVQAHDAVLAVAPGAMVANLA